MYVYVCVMPRPIPFPLIDHAPYDTHVDVSTSAAGFSAPSAGSLVGEFVFFNHSIPQSQSSGIFQFDDTYQARNMVQSTEMMRLSQVFTRSEWVESIDRMNQSLRADRFQHICQYICASCIIVGIPLIGIPSRQTIASVPIEWFILSYLIELIGWIGVTMIIITDWSLMRLSDQLREEEEKFNSLDRKRELGSYYRRTIWSAGVHWYGQKRRYQVMIQVVEE